LAALAWQRALSKETSIPDAFGAEIQRLETRLYAGEMARQDWDSSPMIRIAEDVTRRFTRTGKKGDVLPSLYPERTLPEMA
ncbi:MAG: hypothetical protein K5905_30920, partial [Roseibium sp.]|uniref:hypothetical protein n=1 Tax=Roseibium sp. TaxID=1936156 RepID=UPI00260CA00D